jgi:hypothetical protein
MRNRSRGVNIRAARRIAGREVGEIALAVELIEAIAESE